jgi:hypothetical protein
MAMVAETLTLQVVWLFASVEHLVATVARLPMSDRPSLSEVKLDIEIENHKAVESQMEMRLVT